MIDGGPQNLVFQKSLGTVAKRHRVRIMETDFFFLERSGGYSGAATHDIAVEHTKTMTEWTHRIDPHIDRERDWVESDLLFIGSATGYAEIDPFTRHPAMRPTPREMISSATALCRWYRLGPAHDKPAGPPAFIYSWIDD